MTANNKNLNRRDFLKTTTIGLASITLSGCTAILQTKNNRRPPNFIIIFCDDLGYGDLSCYTPGRQPTPNLDQMAADGMRFTSFYVASPVCSPSRAALMSGCYPLRIDMHNDAKGKQQVLPPVSKKGLNPKEITIAEILKEAGYTTACIGKWHLGDQPQFLPTRQGFDYYFGIPYSNDMGPRERHPQIPPLPLMRNEKVIEAPVDQNTITRRYTDETIKFITENKDKPFFVYLPHTMPHIPIHVGAEFRGKSRFGKYGDVVAELDYSTGRILKTLKAHGIDKNTLVIFTSDNGAPKKLSNLPLSGSKGMTAEGGMRVPCIMRWPGKIPTGKVCDELTTAMDLLPTLTKLAAAKEPTDRIIDGKNIWPLMAGKKGAKSPHKVFYYYQKDQLQAVRTDNWKLHLPIENKIITNWKPRQKGLLALYNIKNDISEKYNVADKHPDVVSKLIALAENARDRIGDEGVKGANFRRAGYVENSMPLLLSSD